MADAGVYQTMTVNVPAGQTQVVACAGQFLACFFSNQSVFGVQIDQYATALFAQGIKVRVPAGQTFGSLLIDNTMNVGALQATLAFGTGDYTDSRVSGALTTDLVLGTSLATSRGTVGAAAVKVAPYAATRQRVMIRNLSAVETLDYGPSTVTSGAGMPIMPNEVATIDGTTADIWLVGSAAGVPYALSIEE